MKTYLKRTIGHTLISAGNAFPKARPVFKKLGLRTTEALFGEREVSIPLGNGSNIKLTNLSKNFLSFQLFWRGVGFYEPVTMMVFKYLLQPNRIFFDVGANIGFFSLMANRICPGLSVVAFEPQPKNFEILKRNVNANGFRQITCEPLALSDKSGTARLYLHDSDMSASLQSDFQREQNTHTDFVDVPVATLDGYMTKPSAPAPCLIKVDVEGHEAAFLDGARQTMSRYKPDLIIEVLKDYSPEHISFLKELGYGFYPITDKGFIDAPGLSRVPPQPFHFLNYLVSTRSKAEIGALFAGIEPQVRKINFYETCKHVGALTIVADCPVNLLTTLNSLMLTA